MMKGKLQEKVSLEGSKKSVVAVLMVFIMLFSTQMYSFQDFEPYSGEESEFGPVIKRTAFQQIDVSNGPMAEYNEIQPGAENPFSHPAFTDPMYHDPLSVYGKVSDSAALAIDPSYGFMLEETDTEDHDNDGISDLYDLDDDNDGINDLIERFDGCYGTDPFDHDNDGVQDEFDWDDDNDGLLEGPIDWSQGADPKNNTEDRYVVPTVIHPWTQTPVGTGYRIDQNPLDHDNDGVSDDDIDGTGAGSYDEDDDNDGRIDQFTWPCDFDSDGIQDYFDLDDDGDSVPDMWDAHPWNSDITSNITENNLWDDWVEWDSGPTTHQILITNTGLDPENITIETGDIITWINTDAEDHSVQAQGNAFSSPLIAANGGVWSFQFNNTVEIAYQNLGVTSTTQGNISVLQSTFTGSDYYGDFVGGIDFVEREKAWHPKVQAFSNIFDGDLDGDGIPNFLDPDNDNDGSPDSSDTDDDNDGLADMYDVDDDNDGIPDTCLQTDTNLDAAGDYPVPNQAFYSGAIMIPGIDCEMDYDRDFDDDRYRVIDQDYDLVWDWLDTDLGGVAVPDNTVGGTLTDSSDLPWDLDNDGEINEVDIFPTIPTSTVDTWDCPSLANPNPSNPDDNCYLMRKSYTGFNDWDGDGINNWDDIDDDNDGIFDWLDIDDNCDLDDDNDLHLLNGSKYRDDGPNDIDTDVDGDGLPNDEDWDDDNDGISDYYDPDDGNCGIQDLDATDPFDNSYPTNDGDLLDGSSDDQLYQFSIVYEMYWNQTWMFNPFTSENGFVLDYNGFDEANPSVSGQVPELYWHVIQKWSPYNGDNHFDIDIDGDSLINGIDVDQDGDGLPDWWDQDEGNDGVLDVNDIKMGGTFDDNTCGATLFWIYVPQQPQAIDHECGIFYAWYFGAPLVTPTRANQVEYTYPYSTRPDPDYSDGAYNGSNSQGQWTCNKNCFHFTFDPQSGVSPTAAVTYNQMKDNRDLWIAYIGLSFGFFQWTADSNANFFPDERADLLNNDVDPDDDCGAPVTGNMEPQCLFNDTADLDDDFDGVYDHWDIDDDSDGIWDYFEIDSNDDLDDDTGTLPPGNFYTGSNCEDNDDDGTDTDPDEDGWYQAVHDKGVLGQGLLNPKYYDVDNDNDGVPDGEDPDDDNNGVLDSEQELLCFVGEEQMTWDHDNDGIVNWMDDDWDGDGRSNQIELNTATPFISAWDHDNDGLRDDIDLDDDSDGMEDKDEIMLWPSRYGSESTNPWDHDDFGGGEGIANPSDPTTGPDAIDIDDDNDSRIDADWDQLEEEDGNSSDWDSDNDGILDEDDKIPTRITLTSPEVLWLDNLYAAKFNGTVSWLDLDQGVFAPAENLPVQVHIAWTRNGTSAVETVDVLTDADGRFVVGQFLFPEDLPVGSNTTYHVYAEVTEMFLHDGSSTQPVPTEVRANTTIDYVAWTYFRSDEQPLFVDYKVHYAADWDRGIFDNKLSHAPVSFTVHGGPFGNVTHPTIFDGYGYGYRADSGGWISLSFVQTSGSQGVWKQVQWNSTVDNGEGKVPGAYEEIVWDNTSKSHSVVGLYEYTNTSLPIGDYMFIGESRPDLGAEMPWPYLEGDKTDSFAIRSMHRMYVEADIITPSIRPVYFYDSTQFTGASFGAWRALFHAPSLANAGLEYSQVSLGKQYPMLWDGTPQGLTGEAANLRSFLSSNGTDWFIAMQNGGDFNVPPCGPINPQDPASEIRCEIVPEMFTGETFRVLGTVWNRTMTAWPHDAMALQVDIDKNGVFAGSQETGFARVPDMVNGEAVFDYNWTWYSQYPAGVYGIRADFTNSNYYFTGNQSAVLAPTGAYVNVSVIGTTDFQLNNIPRLYRGQNATIEARVIDNAYQPVRDAPVNYTWSADGTSDVAVTDLNGVFKINLTIDEMHELGNFSLSFTYPGDTYRQGSSSGIDLWVVSRTYIDLQSTTENRLSSGDIWEFTAQVTDDNRTAAIKDKGELLDGCDENGGEILVILEGVDFEQTVHRQIIKTLCPNAGTINHAMLLDPQLLRDDPQSFLPDGFGPVNVIIRFSENLPHEGCEPIDQEMLSISGAWDPCAQVLNSDHYRKVFQYNGQGFSLIGGTQLSVDNQIVYTSEIDQLTGQPIDKPMTVTGQLVDELNTNLSNRPIQVQYEMVGTELGVKACNGGVTDSNGFFSIICPLNDIQAGQAKVTVNYYSYETGDQYRYKNSSITKFFPVFSNSTMTVQEVGPFRTDIDTYRFENGTVFPVLYLKESFHIDAKLAQVNGNPVGGKCLNIYLDPETNTRPFATAITQDGTGEIEWYSGDPEDNPSRKGVEPSGQKLEGFRTIRIAYEPTKELPGGCKAETTPVVNGSYEDIEVLVRSKVDILLKDHWARAEGYQEGDIVTGKVSILRDRLDVSVEGETVIFTFQYWNGTGYVTNNVEYSVTNEKGEANFSFVYSGKEVPGETKGNELAVNGQWRVLVHFQESAFFQEEFLNSTPTIELGEIAASSNTDFWTFRVLTILGIMASFVLLIGAIMYRNYNERRRIEIIRGILTDSLMSLKASNDYIATIFDCYKQLVRFFRSRGAMKKVYETTREFEDAVHTMLGGITPPEDLDTLFSIFEEARYSDHEIGADQRDRAMEALQSIINHLSNSLGESMLSRTASTESGLYGSVVKAGSFVDSEGQTRIAGIDDDDERDGFSL